MIHDLRYIKGSDRVVRIPESWSGKRSICEFCAAKTFCKLPNKTFSACGFPILPLTFQDDTGLHLPAFSTIRLGEAWRHRVNENPGSIVALIHKTKKRQRFLGYAAVTSACTYTKTGVLDVSWDNHMVFANGKPAEENREYLSALLRRYYGGFDQDESKAYTSIDLERLTDEESARVEETWPVAQLRKNHTLSSV